MARSHESFSKKEKEKKKHKKRLEKERKREERKNNTDDKSFDDMIAYVDEFGNITDTPPEPSDKEEIEAEDIVLGVPKKEKVELDPIRKGKVAFFNDSKGFGFIYDNETQEKHFVHVNGLIDEIQENDRVSFELEKGMKGMNAVRVKKI